MLEVIRQWRLPTIHNLSGSCTDPCDPPVVTTEDCHEVDRFQSHAPASESDRGWSPECSSRAQGYTQQDMEGQGLVNDEHKIKKYVGLQAPQNTTYRSSNTLEDGILPRETGFLPVVSAGQQQASCDLPRAPVSPTVFEDGPKSNSEAIKKQDCEERLHRRNHLTYESVSEQERSVHRQRVYFCPDCAIRCQGELKLLEHANKKHSGWTRVSKARRLAMSKEILRGLQEDAKEKGRSVGQFHWWSPLDGRLLMVALRDPESA